MGCGREIACLDCRKTYSVGYGSYSTWANVWERDGQTVSLAAYDSWAAQYPEDAAMLKNQLTRQVLSEHEGHQLEVYSEDYTTLDRESGHLYVSTTHDHYVLVPDAASFEFINLYDNHPNVTGEPI